MKTFKIPVEWVMAGEVEIEAETLKQAMSKFKEVENELPLPAGECVDGSFKFDENDDGMMDMLHYLNNK